MANNSWERTFRWLWLIVFLGSTSFVFRSAADIVNEGYVAVETIHKVVSIGIIAFAIAFLTFKHPPRLSAGPLSILVVFSLWRLFSALWSPWPLWTLYRSFEYISVVVLVVHTVNSLSNYADLRKWLNWVWAWIGIMIGTAYLGIWLFPEEALVRRPDAFIPVGLTGVLPRINPDGLAQMGAILTLVGLSRWFAGRAVGKAYAALVLLGLTTMILAQGRAAIGGFFVGIITVFLIYRRIGLLWGLSTVFLAAILFWREQILSGIWDFVLRGQSADIFWGWSSRLLWWDLVWRYMIRDNVLLGHGAFAGGRLLAPLVLGISIGERNRITLDNAWLELLADTGVVSLVLFLIVVTWVFKTLLCEALRGLPDARLLAVECLAVFSLLVFRSFFASSITLYSEFSFWAVVGCAEFLRRHKTRISP